MIIKIDYVISSSRYYWISYQILLVDYWVKYFIICFNGFKLYVFIFINDQDFFIRNSSSSGKMFGIEYVWYFILLISQWIIEFYIFVINKTIIIVSKYI